MLDHATPLTLYNSLTRQKEVFTPIDASHVRIYACGPTVYSYAHIGNARMAVVFDLLVRVLRRQYPKVTYASNITDVDDKIMQAAIETGEAIDIITRKYERIYNEDMAALGVAAPDIQPRATEHIAEMIALMQSLIAKGHAYEAEGHVLFNVPSFPLYGGLSGRSRDDQIAGARVDVAPYKRDPADFVLWKPSKDGQPGWDSPFGFGRPGWHIECSAMAEKHLGLPFDIHGGGADLKFPHHENEIAQSCCGGHGASPDNLGSFARMWVHNGFLTVNGEKMSKSLGNFTTVHDLLQQGVKGEVIRLALMSAQYSSPLDWNDKALSDSQKLLERVYTALKDDDACADVPDAQVMAALLDDLNTPAALAALHALLKDGDIAKLRATMDFLGFPTDAAFWFAGKDAKRDALAAQVEALLVQRAEARAAKDWAKSDVIRDQLTAMGVVVKDTPQGVVWDIA